MQGDESQRHDAFRPASNASTKRTVLKANNGGKLAANRKLACNRKSAETGPEVTWVPSRKGSKAFVSVAAPATTLLNDLDTIMQT